MAPYIWTLFLFFQDHKKCHTSNFIVSWTQHTKKHLDLLVHIAPWTLSLLVLIVYPTQDGRGAGQKGPRTSFSPVTSTDVLLVQNVSDFCSGPFCYTIIKCQCLTYCQAQIIELEPRAPLKKKRFSGHIEKISKTEVMITSLIEKLEFPHITLVTWTHLQYSLNHVINFFGDILDRNYDIITFISKYFILRRPRGANLAGIIKIATIFMKATFKYSKKK